jgi:TRAP transporter 4TM/12TM fusion protein
VDESGRFRTLGPGLGLIERALVSALTLLGAAWTLELQFYLPTPIFKEQFLGLVIGLSLVAIFIGVKTHRGETGRVVPWFDWIAAALSVVLAGYIVVNYRELVYDLGSLVTERYVLGAIAVVLVLEATRRMTGWTLVVLAIVFIAYAKFSHLFPGMLNVPSTAWERIAIYLYLDGNAMLGLPINVTATIIIAFILFGRVLYAVNGDRVLTDFALATMGRFRGGPAKVAVIASSLFGTISGSAVSNVVMDGPITIPMMKKAGYPAHQAAAMEAVASTGGQIMPPVMGITAFLIAEFLSVDYAEVVIAALIPAVLYYLAVFAQVDLQAAKLGISGMPREEIPRFRDVARTGWVFAVPIFVLIWTLFAEGWQPGRAAMAAVIATVIVGYAQKSTRPTLGKLLTAVEETGRTILDLAVITLLAGMVIGALQLSGLSFNFSLMLLSLSGESMVALLLMTAVVCIILGMGMPTGVIYVLLAVLVAPALEKMGVVPMAAHMFLFYFGLMSMVTPPVCLATFAAASIAQSDFWRSGWAGMRLAVAAYIVPFVMVYQPELVFSGSATDITLVAIKTAIGVMVLTPAMVGFMFHRIGFAARVVLGLAGAAIMLIPLDVPNAVPMLAAVFLIAAGMTVWERRRVVPQAEAGAGR